MNINISLIGQMLTFAFLIWVTTKYVWPPLMNAVDQRNKEIADGLAAAEQGRRDLAEADERAKKTLAVAASEADARIREGKSRKDDIVAAAAAAAQAEADKIVAAGRMQIETERTVMVRELQKHYADLIVAGSARILRRSVDASAHRDIVEGMLRDLERHGA